MLSEYHDEAVHYLSEQNGGWIAVVIELSGAFIAPAVLYVHGVVHTRREAVISVADGLIIGFGCIFCGYIFSLITSPHRILKKERNESESLKIRLRKAEEEVEKYHATPEYQKRVRDAYAALARTIQESDDRNRS